MSVLLAPRRQLTEAEVAARLDETNPEWPAVWASTQGEESATSVLEAAALYAAVLDVPSALPPRAPGLARWVVELGCWKCRTAIVLGHAVAARSHDLRAATVDPLAPYEEPDLGWNAIPPSPEWVRDRLMTRGAGHVQLVHAPSVDAGHAWLQGPVALLFVDGLHTADAVRADWEAWRPHLTENAVVVFHDTAIPWIGAFVDELVALGELHDPREAGIGTVLVRRPGQALPTVDRLLRP